MSNPVNKLTDLRLRWDDRFLKIGQFLFLLGVAFLIIRKNTYPWPIKRASDILFLLSSICALPHWNIIKTIFNKIKISILLILGGLLSSSLFAYFFLNLKIINSSVLSFGRFIEVIIIILLVGFFQAQDKDFYKKIAVAQLSTLIYILTLIIPSNIHNFMYRFELFENWPSNSSYYLIPSIILIISSLFYLNNNYKKILIYLAGSGLIAIMLWTQSRATWFAMFLSIVIFLIIWSRKSALKFLLGFVIVLGMTVIGFFSLMPSIQNEIIYRIFPQIRQEKILQPNQAAQIILEENLSPKLYETSRPHLWKKFGKRIIENPLGEGLNYRLERDQIGDAKGPHNTILEILINGGIISLLGYLSLFYLGFKNILGKKFDMWRTYVFISLIGLTIASQFDNMSTFRLLWVLLGLSIYL